MRYKPTTPIGDLLFVGASIAVVGLLIPVALFALATEYLPMKYDQYRHRHRHRHHSRSCEE